MQQSINEGYLSKRLNVDSGGWDPVFEPITTDFEITRDTVVYADDSAGFKINDNSLFKATGQVKLNYSLGDGDLRVIDESTSKQRYDIPRLIEVDEESSMSFQGSPSSSLELKGKRDKVINLEGRLNIETGNFIAHLTNNRERPSAIVQMSATSDLEIRVEKDIVFLADLAQSSSIEYGIQSNGDLSLTANHIYFGIANSQASSTIAGFELNRLLALEGGSSVIGGDQTDLIAFDGGRVGIYIKGYDYPISLKTNKLQIIGDNHEDSLGIYVGGDVSNQMNFSVGQAYITDVASGIAMNLWGSASLEFDNLWNYAKNNSVKLDVGSRLNLIINDTAYFDEVILIENESFASFTGQDFIVNKGATINESEFVVNANSLLMGNISSINSEVNITTSDFQALTTKETDSALSFSDHSNGQIKSTGKSIVKGNIYVSDSTVDISLGAQSEFSGKTILGSKNSILNLTLGDNSYWGNSGDSALTTLTASASTISFSTIGSSQAPNLFIGALDGANNEFALKLDASNAQSSFIQLGDQSKSGKQFISLQDSLTPTEDLKIHFANDLSGNVTFEGVATLTEAGLLITTPNLVSQNTGNGKDWFITAVKNDPAPTPIGMIDGFQNNYLFWRTLTDTTKERFGQLRHGEASGAWGRITAGSLSEGDLTNDYQTYRLGADTSIDSGLTLGATLEIHQGELDTSNGSGDMKAYTGGLYGLMVTPTGYYADAGIRFGVMDYEYANSAMLADRYDYKATALGAWLEMGKEWTLAQNYTITPHVAVNYGHFGTEDFKTRNGLNAKVDSVDSVIFTAGTDIGYKTDTFEITAVADVMTEVAGKQDIRVSHEDASLSHKADYSDTWMEFGLSAGYRPTDNTQFWLNARRSAFAQVDNDWRINAGVRWSF